jgi:serine/threonine protein kinase
MLTETPTTLPAPTIDGKYRLEALVGEGAYGTVYRALHLGLKRAFALKLLHASAAGEPELIARFRREAEALGRLRHPGVVERSEERRVGKECRRLCRSRWSPYH